MTTNLRLPSFVGLLFTVMEAGKGVYEYEWCSPKWDGRHWEKKRILHIVCLVPSIKTEHQQNTLTMI